MKELHKFIVDKTLRSEPDCMYTEYVHCKL